MDEEAAIAEAQRCLNCALCSECGECTAACEHKAIDHEMTEKIIELDVGAVVMTPGFDEFQAEAKGEFGFGRYSNVMTTVQFERMLSAAGPFAGHVQRLSDGKDAKRIAWIQCVGSRDSKCGNDYCSSICCMATTKQTIGGVAFVVHARHDVDSRNLDITSGVADLHAVQHRTRIFPLIQPAMPRHRRAFEVVRLIRQPMTNVPFEYHRHFQLLAAGSISYHRRLSC